MGGARPVLDADGRFVTSGPGWAARAIDANLGVSGLPQSGTGQTALLTGENAPELYGRHFGPWVPTGLQELLGERNLFRRLRSLGGSAAFANAAPGGRDGAQKRATRRPGAFPFATLAADVLIRDETDLREGRALASSITTDEWRASIDPRAPEITPAEAGKNLAHISRENRFTAFAHWNTDYIGHRGGMTDALMILSRVDEFLGGVITHFNSDALLVVTSDHGNLEDLSTTMHTRNPIPLLAFGPSAHWFCGQVENLSGFVPAVLELLGLEDR
jgi:hypothetical protein